MVIKNAHKISNLCVNPKHTSCAAANFSTELILWKTPQRSRLVWVELVFTFRLGTLAICWPSFTKTQLPGWLWFMYMPRHTLIADWIMWPTWSTPWSSSTSESTKDMMNLNHGWDQASKTNTKKGGKPVVYLCDLPMLVSMGGRGTELRPCNHLVNQNHYLLGSLPQIDMSSTR